MSSSISEREIAFILFEMLNTESLLTRERYSTHSRETFNATLDTARHIAEKYFANHNVKGDANEPTFDGKRASVIPETKEAWQHFSSAGFLAAHYDFEEDGMQLPEAVLRGAMALFFAANISSGAYPLLTIGVANLIHAFGNQAQKDLYLPLLISGQCTGTMCLTEPDQGSALADIKTTARKCDDGTYRITGNKVFISGGDQNITDNIIHMVLAKIEGAPPGAKGISMFICPKFLVNEDGTYGDKNDIALAGLFHKMGYRNTTSTALNFGENDGAIGFLVGEPHHGLSYMFQMMNEARIAVGLGASALGYRGFQASLGYARDRKQGRLPSDKNPESPQVRLVEHADIRRMLLAQKAFAEGSLAMCLYASSLHEDTKTAETEEERKKALELLNLLTPMVKSWPSKYSLVANDYAIQILGGAGYTREYPVEQFWRDNRLNPIHEGTEGIHGLDLLGRKASTPGFRYFLDAVSETVAATKDYQQCSVLAAALENSCKSLEKVTQCLLDAKKESVDLALANATIYLDVFGNIFAAWIWLRQAAIAEEALKQASLTEQEENYYRGKIETARYFYNWELPQIAPKISLLSNLDSVTLDMKDEWF